MTLSDRVRKLIEVKKESTRSFSAAIGVANTTLSGQLDSGNFTSKVIVCILDAYPNLNAEWLMRGEGDMFKRQLNISNKIGKLPNKLLKCMDIDPKLETIDEILDTVPTVNQNEMIETTPENGIAYYDVDFAGGYDDFLDNSIVPDAYFTCKGFEKADCFVNVSGDSMSPVISNGDVIAIKRVADTSFISLGEIYAIVTRNGMRTIKKVRKGTEQNSVTLVPINPDYDSQELPKKDIRELYIVIGCLKRF